MYNDLTDDQKQWFHYIKKHAIECIKENKSYTYFIATCAVIACHRYISETQYNFMKSNLNIIT